MNSRALAVALALLAGNLSAVDSPVKAEALGLPINPVKPSNPADMAARFFHDALRPYGQWIEVEGYGLCWKPKVDPKWSPYTVGQWAFSDFGWTWMSDEDFGSIVYHYGRWLRTREEDWCWVPDLEWAASWVSWRYGTEYLGWAPLPPAAAWQPAVGIAPWVDRETGMGPDIYRFCLIANIGSADLPKVLLPVSENGDKLRRTVNTTNISSYRGSVFSGGPAYDWISSRTRESVEILQIVKERSLLKYREQLTAASENPAKFRGLRRGNKVLLMAPEWALLIDPRRADNLGFHTDEGPEAPSADWTEGDAVPSVPKLGGALMKGQRFVATPTVLTGWESVSDPATLKFLQTKVAREAGGMHPGNYPARPVDPEMDLPTSIASSLR
jgi:hypothetical protein